MLAIQPHHIQLTPRQIKRLAQDLPGIPAFTPCRKNVQTRVFNRHCLQDISRQLRHGLIDGSGLVFVSIPSSESLTNRQLEWFQAALGEALGTLMPQDRERHISVEVKDTAPVDPVNNRGFRTNVGMSLHTDGWDAASLMCLQSADQGGTSLFVSSRDLYEQLRNRQPDCLDLLQSDMKWDVRVLGDYGSRAVIHSPVFSTFQGVMSCRYGSYMLRKGWDAEGLTIPDDILNAIDQFDRLCGDHRRQYRHKLTRGTSVWMNNRTVLHGRDMFFNSDHLSGQRHMLRLWIKVRGAPPVHPDFEHFDVDCFS